MRLGWGQPGNRWGGLHQGNQRRAGPSFLCPAPRERGGERDFPSFSTESHNPGNSLVLSKRSWSPRSSFLADPSSGFHVCQGQARIKEDEKES